MKTHDVNHDIHVLLVCSVHKALQIRFASEMAVELGDILRPVAMVSFA